MLLIVVGFPDEESWDEAITKAYSAGWVLFSDDPDIETPEVSIWCLRRVVAGG